MSAHPAASSLPPSDGGGAPNIPQGTQRAYWCRVRNVGASGECNRLLVYCNAYIMPLSDHCNDAPANAIPHGDDGDYVWTGWVEEACEQCETYWSFSGTVIRWMELPQDWSAPTQQPAEQPEAGGDWDARDILNYRVKHGLTQQAFADLLDVRQATVSDWETFAVKPSRLAQLAFRGLRSELVMRPVCTKNPNDCAVKHCNWPNCQSEPNSK